MLGRVATCVTVIGVLAGFGLAEARQAAERPDFTGVWTTYRGGGGGGRGGGQALPLRDEAQRRVAEYQALVSPTGDTPGGYCLGTGMPGSMLGSGGYPMEVIQREDQITVIYEAHNEIRRIYFGNRIIPPADRLPERNGYSTGRWEGDTLVVETTHLKEQVDQRYPHSAEAHIVERYSLSTDEAGTKVLTAEMTMTDPAFYSEPFSEVKRWAMVPNGFLMTYECNEPAWNLRLEALKEAAGSTP